MRRGLNFESKVRIMVNMTRTLMGCGFLYSDFSDRVIERIEDYQISTGNPITGHLVRMWNNSCVFDPEQDFELKLSNIAYIARSDELDFSVIVIKKEDIVYNAIPLSCVSLSGKRVSTIYEGNDSASFSRLINVLYPMALNLFATDPATYLDNSEHIILRYFKAQVILALCLKYSIADSPRFKKYGAKDLISKLLALSYTDDSVKPLAEIFNRTITEIFHMADSMSFVEIFHELFDDNVLAKYYREMAFKLYEIEHPSVTTNEVTKQVISETAKAVAKNSERVPIEQQLEGAFDSVIARAKESKLKDRKIKLVLDETGKPNQNVFA